MRLDVFEVAFSEVTLQICVLHYLYSEKGNIAFSEMRYKCVCSCHSHGKKHTFFSEKSGSMQLIIKLSN